MRASTNSIAVSLLLGFHIFAAAVPTYTEAIVLHKCDIVTQLEKIRSIDRSMIVAWTCVVMNESGGDTRKVSHAMSGQSRKYGIFQIDSGDWCNEQSETIGRCGVRCSDLLTDEIDRRNFDCATKFWKANGFKGWPTYDSHCKKRLPSISECLQPVRVQKKPSSHKLLY